MKKFEITLIASINITTALAWNFIKKGSLAQMFSCEFCKISKNTFFTEHLRTSFEKTTQEFSKFGDADIKKIEFHCSKKTVNVNNVDVEKLLVSDEFTYGSNKERDAKHFIKYKQVKKIRPLVSGYRNKFKKNKCISFLSKDKLLLGKYEMIWDTIRSIMGKEFYKDSVNGNKFLNTKIKSFGGKITSDFPDNKEKEKTLKIGSHYLCLHNIVLNSVFSMKNDDDYKWQSQISSEQRKCEEMKNKEKKTKRIKKKKSNP